MRWRVGLLVVLEDDVRFVLGACEPLLPAILMDRLAVLHRALLLGRRHRGQNPVIHAKLGLFLVVGYRQAISAKRASKGVGYGPAQLGLAFLLWRRVDARPIRQMPVDQREHMVQHFSLVGLKLQRFASVGKQILLLDALDYRAILSHED